MEIIRRERERKLDKALDAATKEKGPWPAQRMAYLGRPVMSSLGPTFSPRAVFNEVRLRKQLQNRDLQSPHERIKLVYATLRLFNKWFFETPAARQYRKDPVIQSLVHHTTSAMMPKKDLADTMQNFEAAKKYVLSDERFRTLSSEQNSVVKRYLRGVAKVLTAIAAEDLRK